MNLFTLRLLLLLTITGATALSAKASPIQLVSEPLITGGYTDGLTVGDTIYCTNGYGVFVYKFHSDRPEDPLEELTHFPTPEQDAIDIDESDAYLLAQRLFEAGEFLDALDMFQEVIATDPSSNEALFSLGYIPECYKALERAPEELIAYYRGVSEVCADDRLAAQCRLLVPRVYIEERRFDEALAAYESLQSDPRSEVERLQAEIGSLELSQSLDLSETDSWGDRLRIKLRLDDLQRRLLDASQKDIVTQPRSCNLLLSYPNPFNSSAAISYEIAAPSRINLSVFDLNGRLVKVLNDGSAGPGSYRAVWNASGSAPGVYFVRLQANSGASERKLVLVK